MILTHLLVTGPAPRAGPNAWAKQRIAQKPYAWCRGSGPGLGLCCAFPSGQPEDAQLGRGQQKGASHNLTEPIACAL